MRKVAHGDIKSDNVLITSDLTVLLTDFSSAFKPTYLPLDDPSDFSFFFDSSARRTCYIAPERFYEADSKIAQDKAASAAASSSESGTTINAEPWEKRDGKVTEEMDVFSAGCVIAETWTDGRTVFNLSELFAYRNGSLGLEGILDNLEDDNVKDMIAQMLSREPEQRPSFDRILAEFRGTIFPEYFYTFLNDYVTELGELPDSPTDEFLNRASTLPGTKIDTMLEQWDSISVPLEGKDVNESELPGLHQQTHNRWPGSSAAQHCHIVYSQLPLSELPTAWPQALPQPLSVPHGRGQGGPHCAVCR
jgi:phosphoinositide-3-kinase regulatory subunit 4